MVWYVYCSTKWYIHIRNGKKNATSMQKLDIRTQNVL